MHKFIEIEGLHKPVIITRRRGSRNLRLSIKTDGTAKLNVPYGVSEHSANRFIRSKLDWIIKHQKPSVSIKNNDHIGKSHTVAFEWSKQENITTRVGNNSIRIRVPIDVKETDPEVQRLIKKACERVLNKEAKHLLPQRLDFLSKKFNIPYNSVKTKKLKSRWGSCDTNQNIILNSYLIQLDWSLIDYVILHELTHTKHKHHQADFWGSLEKIMPDYKMRRKLIKAHPTDIVPTNF